MIEALLMLLVLAPAANPLNNTTIGEPQMNGTNSSELTTLVTSPPPSNLTTGAGNLTTGTGNLMTGAGNLTNGTGGVTGTTAHSFPVGNSTVVASQPPAIQCQVNVEHTELIVQVYQPSCSYHHPAKVVFINTGPEHLILEIIIEGDASGSKERLLIILVITLSIVTVIAIVTALVLATKLSEMTGKVAVLQKGTKKKCKE